MGRDISWVASPALWLSSCSTVKKLSSSAVKLSISRANSSAQSVGILNYQPPSRYSSGFGIGTFERVSSTYADVLHPSSQLSRLPPQNDPLQPYPWRYEIPSPEEQPPRELSIDTKEQVLSISEPPLAFSIRLFAA